MQQKKQHISWRCKKICQVLPLQQPEFFVVWIQGAWNQHKALGWWHLHTQNLCKEDTIRGTSCAPRVWPPLRPTFYSMLCTLKINEDRQLSRQQRNRIYRKKLIFQPQSTAKFTWFGETPKYCTKNFPIVVGHPSCPYPAAVNESPRAKMVTLLPLTSRRNSWGLWSVVVPL